MTDTARACTGKLGVYSANRVEYMVAIRAIDQISGILGKYNFTGYNAS